MDVYSHVVDNDQENAGAAIQAALRVAQQGGL
jgi:hypothetical protein